MGICKRNCLYTLVLLMTSACRPNEQTFASPYDDSNGDSDTIFGLGGDADADVDAVTNSDVDADADSDTDSDTDTDVDTDVDADADSDSDSDVDTDVDADADSDTDTDMNADTENVDATTDLHDATDNGDDSESHIDANSDPDAIGDSDSTSDASIPATGRFPAVDDVWEDGPWESVTVNNTGPGGAYTIFHPDELAPGGIPNPILSWGNGGMTSPSMYPEYLPHFASHGFFVVAANTSMVSGDDIVKGIDWIIEQNQDPGSKYYQKLDENNICALGYSMGSLGTFDMADDPRLTTTVHISGGARGDSSVKNLRQMAAFFCDENTTAPNCDPDFDVAPVPVFYGIFLGTDHVGTMLEPWSARVAGATVGWLRWRLMADETQKKLFVGDDCELCTSSDWKVHQKDLM